MKKINKVIIGVVGSISLLSGTINSVKANDNGSHRYGSGNIAVGTQNYKDLVMNVVKDNAKYTFKPTPTYASKPTPTYVSKPTPTYVSKPTPTYGSKPTPTYGSKPTPTYTSKPTAKPTVTYGSKPTPTYTSKPTIITKNYFETVKNKILSFFKGLFGR